MLGKDAGLEFGETETWLHTGTEADSVRERPSTDRRDSVTIRLPSARYGVSDSGQNPCLSIGRCTWIVPWVRALRIKPREPRPTSDGKNDNSTDSGWLWLPTGPPYVHVQ
ncbi:hypothetical protein HPB52_004362 [Rhipicephalus sanguineus]|uniref:Uncharacterized protein n=1 Tax=Rhipicephalus sanguineus TaxID=34632 RepID=A0A9D4SMA3_RHISA|nr:hypothetical protein HPB52_004362 [Rhipicephalus sanguineus]